MSFENLLNKLTLHNKVRERADKMTNFISRNNDGRNET